MKIKTYAVNCNDAWLNTEGDDIHMYDKAGRDKLDALSWAVYNKQKQEAAQ